MVGAQVRSFFQNQDLRRNSRFALASTIVTLFVGIISAPILAQLLPREEYGALSYVVRDRKSVV